MVPCTSHPDSGSTQDADLDADLDAPIDANDDAVATDAGDAATSTTRPLPTRVARPTRAPRSTISTWR